MKPNRDLLLVLLLFAALIGFIAFLGARQLQDSEQQGTPYSSYAAHGDGTLALHRWLEALGYTVRREESAPLAPSTATSVLLILPSQEPITKQEAQRVLAWVERGGTLILATTHRLASFGDADTSEALTELLDVNVIQSDFAGRATWQQPLLSDLRTPIDVYASAAIEPATGQVSYLTPEGDATNGKATQSILVSFQRGAGRVFVTTAPYLFTNASLGSEPNAASVRGLFRHVSPSTAQEIVFDESHRAMLGGEDGGNWMSLLYETPWGQGLLFALLLSFVYLVLGGKRFGRPLPLPTEVWRRNPSEYALSMAGLYQRAGKRRMALQHYRRQLKRRLAKPFGLNADLPDTDFVEVLRQAEDVQTFNATALLKLLHQLDIATDATSESQFVALAQAATQFKLNS